MTPNIESVAHCSSQPNKIPGFRCQSLPTALFYAWVNVEDTGTSAEEIQKILLEEAGVAAIAGAAFGAEGKNFSGSRSSSARNLLEEALERIQRVSLKGASQSPSNRLFYRTKAHSCRGFE